MGPPCWCTSLLTRHERSGRGTGCSCRACAAAAAAEKGFYIHLLVYALVNAFLFFINSRSGSPWWFVWPAFDWGLGLAIHGVAVSGMRGAGRDWEERRLRELIDEERGRH